MEECNLWVKRKTRKRVVNLVLFVCVLGWGWFKRREMDYHRYNLHSNPTNPGCSIIPAVSLNLCSVPAIVTSVRRYIWNVFIRLSCTFAQFPAFFFLWSSIYIFKGFVLRKTFPRLLVKWFVYRQIKHHASCQALYLHLVKLCVLSGQVIALEANTFKTLETAIVNNPQEWVWNSG